MTAAHYAAINPNSAMIGALHRSGADINAGSPKVIAVFCETDVPHAAQKQLLCPHACDSTHQPCASLGC